MIEQVLVPYQRPRPAQRGFATVYPSATILKIELAQVLLAVIR